MARHAGPSPGIGDMNPPPQTPETGAAAKLAWRRELRRAVAAMPAEARAAGSAEIRERLTGGPVWRAARSVLFYAPRPDEPDLWPLLAAGLAAGKAVYLPRHVPEGDFYEAAQVRDPERDVTVGRFGVREPTTAAPAEGQNQLDLVLVPGLGFDPDGWRLGRGRGYYDRLLATFRSPACGVAFTEQMIARVPREPHDVRLDWIVTPGGWHGTGRSAA